MNLQKMTVILWVAAAGFSVTGFFSSWNPWALVAALNAAGAAFNAWRIWELS